jgi:hypothetical protein
MEDAAFRRDRLQEPVRRLGQRHKELSRQEHQSRLRADFDAAVTERDALADELAEVYPPMAKKLSDLAARIAANNVAIDRINKKGLPDGAKWVASAELVARGMLGFNSGGLRLPSIVEQLRLPAFEPSAHNCTHGRGLSDEEVMAVLVLPGFHFHRAGGPVGGVRAYALANNTNRP